jgi:hypothetical protein
LESFLSRFEFDVLGEKLVGNDHYYLVEGKAKDPRTDPNTMVGWIDFDHGLLVEGTMAYSTGGALIPSRAIDEWEACGS